MDRTIKLLLTVIAVMLGIIALRPYVSLGSNAMAETSTILTVTTAGASSDAGLTNLGIIVQQPSIIKVPSTKTIREMQVLNGANSIIVRYDDQINVYHVQTVNLQSVASTAYQGAKKSIILK